MLRPIRIIVVAVILGHSMPANADIYQLVGPDNQESVAYVIVDASGREVARGRTDPFGRFEVNSAPGTYQLRAQWGRVNLPSIDLVVDGNKSLKPIKIPSLSESSH
jgi:hypothetical protein